MANELSKLKLIKLAEKVQGRAITLNESTKLENALNARRPATPAAVEEVLAEGLQKSASEVRLLLASADDSDRLINEIVMALGK